MYYINGQYVNENEAKISVLDLAVLRGFGVFDYLRTYAGRPFHLREHLQRLKYSAEHIGLSLPNSLVEIEEIVKTVIKLYSARPQSVNFGDKILSSNDCVERDAISLTASERERSCQGSKNVEKNSHFVAGRSINNLEEASIKIIVTGGISPDQFTPHSQSNLIVFAYPLTSFPQHCFTSGVKVITTMLSRSLPTSKTTQYTPAIVAMQRGKAQNALEALYLNAQNEILEATTSNFFGFKNGALYTNCSDEVLIGITREVIRKLAGPYFSQETRAIRYEEIPDLEEAFITSSNKEVMPVVQIDSMKIGDGLVGPKTRLLMELFRSYTQLPQWPAIIISRYQSAPAKSTAS